MSPPGRPKGEYRSAQHEGTPVTRLARARRIALWAGALVVLLAVFLLYLQPDLAVSLANQLWSCF
jgi:1-acyl-sn-glycerol-3-phosphate acyltransferase